MKANILFSVIIPFYDTIDYVRETIESIASQQNFNLDNIEVIIINDGSKHNLNFLYEYRKVIKNLAIYSKPNGNWGSVINYVKNNHLANGKYLTILDSDDKFTNDSLSTVEKFIANEPDIITANFYRWLSNKNKKKAIHVHWLKKSNLFFGLSFNKKRHLLRTPYSFPLVKFYKTNLFYKININLEEKISYQDCVLFHTFIKHCSSWQYINKYLGLYRDDRLDSSSNQQWNINRINAWIKTINNLDKLDASANAYMYCIFKQFRKACKKIGVKNITKQIVLHNDFEMVYIWKPLHRLAKTVFKIITKKMAKKLPLRFI